MNQFNSTIYSWVDPTTTVDVPVKIGNVQYRFVYITSMYFLSTSSTVTLPVMCSFLCAEVNQLTWREKKCVIRVFVKQVIVVSCVHIPFLTDVP